MLGGYVDIEVRARLDRLDRELRTTRARVERFSQTAQRGFNDTQRAVSGMDRAAQAATRAFLALGAAFGLRELQRLSDAYVGATNLLAVTAREGENVANTFENIRQIAAATRAPLEALVSLYNRGSLAADALGASQAQLETFIATVGRALATQGGGAQQARGALIQLSQAIGAGIVRAEEFNSILEGALPIAQAAARGIERTGGSVALLRREVAEGRVTSEEFFNALLSQADAVEEAFNRTVPTISQALTVLRNNLIASFGASSRDAFSGLSQAILLVANNLDVATAAIVTLTAAMSANRIAALGAAAGSSTFATALQLLTVRGGAAIVMSQALRAALAFFTGPVGIAIAAVGALAGGMVLMGRSARDASAAQAELQEQIDRAQISYRTLQDDINEGQSFADASEAVAAMSREINGLSGDALEAAQSLRQQGLQDYADRIDGAREALETLRDTLFDLQTQQQVFENAPASANLGMQDQTFLIQQVREQIAELENDLLDLVAARDDLASRPLLPSSGEDQSQSEEYQDALTTLQRQREVLSQNNELQRLIVANLIRAGIARDDNSRAAREIRQITAEIYELQQEQERAQEAARASEAVRDIIQSLEREYELLQLTGPERERQEIILRAMDAAGRDLTQSELERLDAVIAQTREYENQLEAVNKLKTDIEDAQRAQDAGRNLEGLDRELAREFSPLSILENQLDERMAILEQARENELIADEEFNQRKLQIEQSYALARSNLLLGAGEQMFGALSDLARQYAGEQSGIFKALFAVEQAFALTRAIMNAQVAISQAAASAPPPANIPAIALAVAQTAPPIATIAAQTVSAFEQGGLVRGGQQLIQVNEAGEEYVMSAGPTRKYRQQLEAMNAGRDPGLGSGVNIEIKQEPGVAVEVVGTTPEEVTMIARRIVRSDAPGVVASDMDNPNSSVSKSLSRNVSAPRKRA